TSRKKTRRISGIWWDPPGLDRHIVRMMNMTVREAAFEAYLEIMDDKAYSNIVIDEVLESGELSDKDKGLFTELVYGTVANRLTVECYLQPFYKTQVY